MNVVGVDPSSSSTGITNVIGGELVEKAVWVPPKKATRSAVLLDYYVELSNWVTVAEDNNGKIDLGVVEELSVTRGHKTVRALSHFEAITYLVFEQKEIPILTIKAGVARHLVLGLPVTSSKDDALAEVRRRWPKIRWSPVNQGGPDEADSFVLALAGPIELRRR